MSPCPWCGAGIGPDRGTVLRLLALSTGGVLLLIPSYPDNFYALIASVIVSAALLVVSAPAHKPVLPMAFAAVAVSGLCHTFPAAMAELSLKLRLQSEWLIPAAALIAVCGITSWLSPVPAASKAARLSQSLKTPLALAAAAAVGTAAAHTAAGPLSMAAMAFCCASVLSALRCGAASCTTGVVLFELAFVIPAGGPTTQDSISAGFAVALSVLGIVQTSIGMKRSSSAPSSHP